MKAYVLHAVNDLRYENVPEPECLPGWALIRVKAAGICSSDISRIFRKGTYHFPTIPGHEFSGIVEQTGSSADSSWVGKRVSVFPLIPCRKCLQCSVHHYEMCEQYDYIGSRRDGCFAELVAVPVWNLMELPDTVSFTEGALAEPLAVALHAVRQAENLFHQSVTVIGTGVIGLAAAGWAKVMNAEDVRVIGRSETKRYLAEALQLQYSTFLEKSADIVIEAVGTPDSVQMALTAVKPGGKVILTGNPSRDMTFSQEIYWLILSRQLQILGTWNSFYDGESVSDWTEVMCALEKHELETENLITHRFSQNSLKEGLNLMLKHQEPYCKIVTLWN